MCYQIFIIMKYQNQFLYENNYNSQYNIPKKYYLFFIVLNFNPIPKTENNCPICFNFNKDISKQNCSNHYFCRKCLIKWSKQKKSCPMCRKSFLYIK